MICYASLPTDLFHFRFLAKFCSQSATLEDVDFQELFGKSKELKKKYNTQKAKKRCTTQKAKKRCTTQKAKKRCTTQKAKKRSTTQKPRKDVPHKKPNL